MMKLRYGSTNTFLIPCHNGFLLVDTDYAGTLPAFYKAIKQNGIKISDIVYVLATHYHPDHMGLIPDLTTKPVTDMIAAENEPNALLNAMNVPADIIAEWVPTR